MENPASGLHLHLDLGVRGTDDHVAYRAMPAPSSPDSAFRYASSSRRTDVALDALEQAIWSRSATEGLVHHSDRGGQYLSIRYTERLAEAGMEPSVGSVGDSYDNALAESVIGLFKTEVIRRRGPWRGLEDVEFATLDWVSWYNTQRLLEPIGYVPPVEYKDHYYRNHPTHAMVAGVN